MSDFTAAEAEQFLARLEIFGIKLGLDQVTELLSGLGNPQRKLKFIHLAGTNGKGSVGAILSASLTAAGYKTGFYSSPHLINVRERFRVNGKAISEKDFSACISRIKPVAEAMERAGRCPTYFEVTTALAADWFASSDTDFVIWETGMGGRFDATNVVSPELSIITSVGLDHQDHLGDTLEDIAGEKAGIVKPGIPVYCGRMPDSAFNAVAVKAKTVNAPVFRLPPQSAKFEKCLIDGQPGQIIKLGSREIKFGLVSAVERLNARLAFRALEFLSEKFGFDINKALPGFTKVRWPGRFQSLPGGSIMDGAHNPECAAALVEFLNEYFPGGKYTVIFASPENKDSLDILKILEPKATEFIFTPVKTARKFREPEKLASMLKSFSNLPCRCVSSVEAGIASIPGKLLITGSLYLAGEALKHYFPEEEILDI